MSTVNRVVWSIFAALLWVLGVLALLGVRVPSPEDAAACAYLAGSMAIVARLEAGRKS